MAPTLLSPGPPHGVGRWLRGPRVGFPLGGDLVRSWGWGCSERLDGSDLLVWGWEDSGGPLAWLEGYSCPPMVVFFFFLGSFMIQYFEFLFLFFLYVTSILKPYSIFNYSLLFAYRVSKNKCFLK